MEEENKPTEEDAESLKEEDAESEEENKEQ